MLEVEVFGAGVVSRELPAREIRELCVFVADRLQVGEAHVAVEFVDAGRIARLNAEHRGRDAPTDVLSFPVDGLDGLDEAAPSALGVPRELGDVVICPECTVDLREAVVHGMLHLLGMDHETDDGQMLALQRELLANTPR